MMGGSFGMLKRRMFDRNIDLEGGFENIATVPLVKVSGWWGLSGHV